MKIILARWSEYLLKEEGDMNVPRRNLLFRISLSQSIGCVRRKEGSTLRHDTQVRKCSILFVYNEAHFDVESSHRQLFTGSDGDAFVHVFANTEP